MLRVCAMALIHNWKEKLHKYLGSKVKDLVYNGNYLNPVLREADIVLM